MRDLTIIAISLLTAALLGAVIGWCARRLIAIRDENHLQSRFAHEKRSLTEQLGDADERITDLERAKLQSELDVQEMRNQIRSLEADIAPGATSAGAAELQLAQLKSELQQRDTENRQLTVSLSETQAALEQATASARVQNDIHAGGHAGGQASAIPVLSRVRAADADIAHPSQELDEFDRGGGLPVEGPVGGDTAAGQMELSEDVLAEIDWNAEKYGFPASESAWLEVDPDIAGFSPSEAASNDDRLDGQLLDGQLEDDDWSTAVADVRDNAGGDGLSDSDVSDPAATPAAGVTESPIPARGRSPGMFSRFNKRKK